MNKNYEIKVFELGIDNKKQLFNFKGSLKGFDVKKFQKRLDDIVDKGYVMRACLAAFCYGVYVRLLF